MSAFNQRIELNPTPDEVALSGARRQKPKGNEMKLTAILLMIFASFSLAYRADQAADRTQKENQR